MSIVSRWRAKLKVRRQHLADAKAALATAQQQVKDAAASIDRAKRVIKRHNKTPADRALGFALAQRGLTENPPGSNRGKLIDAWERDVDMLGQPWCGAFMYAALKYAGVKGITNRMRYTPFIVQDGRAGVNGMEKIVPWAERRKGDLLLFNWDGGVVDHVGMFTGINYSDGAVSSIEGNTSSSNAGSQSNGGGVFERRRYPSQVQYVVRPRWNA